MILLSMSLYAQSLGKQTEVNVFLPGDAASDNPVRVLWLLHGMSDDHTGWIRRSCIEVLADAYGVAVVMPNADLSFYVDMTVGGDYCTWISGELPRKLCKILPLSAKPEDNFIAGISMGGYGAFHIALNNPEKFNTAISLSGPMRIDWINRILTDKTLAEIYASGDKNRIALTCKSYAENNKLPELLVNSLIEMSNSRTIRAFEAMFGMDPVLTGNHYDLFYLAQTMHDRKLPLKLIAFCGEQDYHYVSNILFKEFAEKSGLSYHVTTGDGAHQWDYWNRVIPVMLEMLFGKK
ncbi:esterase [Spirochaetia bacterium]|nr:esterase [Spirochaetia bacterium]